MREKLAWEIIEGEAAFYRTEKDYDTGEIRKIQSRMEYDIRRAKIPGGWLVAKNRSDSITFVPDPAYRWK